MSDNFVELGVVAVVVAVVAVVVVVVSLTVKKNPAREEKKQGTELTCA